MSTSFYYIDGPLTGKVLLGDFKPMVYNKYTFALIVRFLGSSLSYRLFADIACLAPPAALPFECFPHVVIEQFRGYSYQAPSSQVRHKLEPYFNQMVITSPGSMIKVIDV